MAQFHTAIYLDMPLSSTNCVAFAYTSYFQKISPVFTGKSVIAPCRATTDMFVCAVNVTTISLSLQKKGRLP